MVTNSWERRIRHLDRRAKPTELRKLRGRLLKSEVRTRRGLPSDAIPGELVMERLRLRFETEMSEPELESQLERLRRAELHQRLLERKRAARSAACRRNRPSVDTTKINLWRRRRDWLHKAEEMGAHGETALDD